MPLFPLPIRVQLALGADLTAYPDTWTWTDVSSYLRQSPAIRISRGRSDEAGQVQPAQCTLQVDNASGDWDSHNPLGAWYGQLRRGTPLRVEVDAGSGWATRFTGLLAELPPRIDPSDSDAWVEVVAAGQLRRLGQGGTSHSPIYRKLHVLALQAHLPLEDPSGSSGPAVAVPNQPSPTLVGVTLGQSDCQPGAEASARLDATSSTITVPLAWGTARPLVTSYNTWSVTWYWKAGAALGSEADLCTVYIGSPLVSRVVIRASTGGQLRAIAYDTAGAIRDNSLIFLPSAAESTWWAFTLRAVGLLTFSQLILSFHSLGSASDTTLLVSDLLAQLDGWPTQVVVASGGVAGSLVNHIAVAAPGISSPDPDAELAYADEPAIYRLARRAVEDSLPLRVVDAPDGGGTLMGAQPVGTTLSLMREVETTDGGVLYEGTDGTLTYLPGSARYNRAVDLAATASELVPPLEPTDDDQHVVNDVTASRPGGGSARYVDYAHMDEFGQYDTSVAVNVAGDDMLPDEASWRVHLGTVDAVRVPTVTLDLAATPSLAGDWLACDIGSRIQITDVPAALSRSDLDLHIEGYTETIDTFTWQAVINASPAAGWQVAVVDGDQRVTGDGSTLAADITSSDTSLQIAFTDAGGPWTTDAGHFPLDIMIGGERITLSAISGSSSPQSATVSARAVNGISKSHSADDAVEVADPAIVAK